MNGDIGHSIGQENSPLKDNSNVSIRDSFSRNVDAFLLEDIIAVAILKTEKLAAAVYLVSGLLSDNEPIKWSIRKIVTEVLSDISPSLSTRSSLDGNDHKCPIENISAKIFQVTSLLRIAWMGGLVSKMNYEILTSEYIKLNDFLIKNFKHKEGDGGLINKSFFVSGEISSLEKQISSRITEKKYLGEEFLSEETVVDGSSDGICARRDFIKDISSKGHLSDKKEFVLKSIPVNSSSRMKTVSGIIVGSVSDRNKRERHDKILSAMSPGISYSVSEIISVIGKSPDTSEKTIQRDLQQMVSIGRLRKTGERRWSRYSLS